MPGRGRPTGAGRRPEGRTAHWASFRAVTADAEVQDVAGRTEPDTAVAQEHPISRRRAASRAARRRHHRKIPHQRSFRAVAVAGSHVGQKTWWSLCRTGGRGRPGRILPGWPRVAPGAAATRRRRVHWAAGADPTAARRRFPVLDWARPGCGLATVAAEVASPRTGRERPRRRRCSEAAVATAIPPRAAASALRRTRGCRGDHPRWPKGSPPAQGEGRGQSQSDPISVDVVYRHYFFYP